MTPLTQPGLALPPLSVALLGGGREGADFLAHLGIAGADFEQSFPRMLASLDGADDPEASQKKATSLALAEVGRGMTGWLTVTSLLAAVHPTYLLRTDELVVVVRPLGPVVEWLVVRDEDVPDTIMAATAEFPADVLITCHQGGTVRASVIRRGGEVRAAARTQDTVDRLSECAAQGWTALLGRLLDEVGATVGSEDER